MSAQRGTHVAFRTGDTNDSINPTDSTRISKELLQDIRRGDAAMADDLVALAPHSGRAFRARSVAGNAAANAAASGNLQDSRAATSPGTAAAGEGTFPSSVTASGGGGGGFSVSVNDTLTANDFVKQKREVGLVRMSLSTKKAEIRKLDEKVNRAEKRLRQQQEQLTNTQEKFNNFLKFSNLEQDAAVRRADDETRAKHAKTIEIKKLSALINHAELEIRKTRLQIDNCIAYKDFLEGLTKSQWFYDVLINLRCEDKREEILLSAEETYQKLCEDLKKAFEDLTAAQRVAKEAEEREKRRQLALKKPGAATASSQMQRMCVGASRESVSTTAPLESKAEEAASLEQQMDELHNSMEDEARAAIAAAEAAIRTEVNGMSLASVKATLHRDYDENRLPMCFSSVDELLEVFINVEEGNLFLIQNCQELEEELEGITIGYMEEKVEMNSMVAQRTAQLEMLEENISEARDKLKALDDRIAGLEQRSSRNAGAATTSSTGANDATARVASSLTSGISGGAAAQRQQMDLTPEELKAQIEIAIGHMFQLLTAGDQLIKTTATTKEAATGEEFNNTNGTSPLVGSGAPKATGKGADAAASASSKGAASQRKSQAGSGIGTSTASRHRSLSSKKKKSSAVSQAQQLQQQQQQRDASMGPVEMLTIVENKLEEYHRYLTNASNHVDAALIQAVMKQSDKQRRRQARLVHLENQEQAQEERIRRALERSQAPIAHRTGKPVRPRSHVEKAVDEKMLRKAERAAAAMEGSGVSIDSDEDGAEFFR